MTRLQHEREGDKKKDEAKKWWAAGGVVGTVAVGAALAQYLYISKVANAAKADMSTNIITAGLMPRIHVGTVPPTQAAIDAYTAGCAAATDANDAATASHAAACAALPPGAAPIPPPIPVPMPPAPAGVPAVKLAVGADDVGSSVMLNNLGATVQHGPTNKVEVNMTGVAITVGSTSINATPASATINGAIISIG